MTIEEFQSGLRAIFDNRLDRMLEAHNSGDRDVADFLARPEVVALAGAHPKDIVDVGHAELVRAAQIARLNLEVA